MLNLFLQIFEPLINSVLPDITISPKNTEATTHKTSGSAIGSDHQVKVFEFFLFCLEVKEDLEIWHNDNVKDLAMDGLEHHVELVL